MIAAPEPMTQPAHLWVPPRRGSYGPEIIDFCDMIGMPTDPEQRLAIDALASFGPGGRWLALETVIIEGRQNGKTMKVVLPITLADLFLFDENPDRIVWTAHVMKTSREAFDEVKQLIDGSEYLSRRVKSINESKSEESIELVNGASLEFLARTAGGGRGLGGKRLAFDEALFLSAASMGSLIPTLSARGNPVINYASSAGKQESDHLRRLRDRGRRGGDPSLIYIEFCAPGSWDDPGCDLGPECPHEYGTEGCSLDDETRWRTANHAIGRGRITIEFVRGERRALTPREFGRERLGWWDDPVGVVVELLKHWAARADATSAPTSRPVFMVDASPKSRSAAIVAAMLRPDGRPHIEVVAHRPGVKWVSEAARQLLVHEPLDWVLDPAGPAGGLLPDLAAVGVEPRQMTARDMGQACEAFAAAVEDELGLVHLDDPTILRAIKGAGKRDIGDGLWAWARRKSDVDISPLVGATGAFWGLSVVPPEEPPPPPPVNAPGEAWETNDLQTAGF
jgi:intracellular sulfur oxidation DsrE/DsrF family protein